MALKFKLETGMQLLSRLTKKSGIENFYPSLFKCGPKDGEIIEIYSESSSNPLLIELITEVLLPQSIGGIEAGTVILNTDGNFNKNSFIEILKHKLHKHVAENNIEIYLNDECTMKKLINTALKNLYLLDVYDSSQLYITILNLENIFMKHPNISLLVFNTLTAFYWSEQNIKVTKMDLYLKKLLKMIQKVVKDFKTVVMYTRPEYFSSTKEAIENLEPCCAIPTEERINYRIQVVYSNDDDHHFIYLQTHDQLVKMPFLLKNGEIIW